MIKISKDTLKIVLFSISFVIYSISIFLLGSTSNTWDNKNQDKTIININNPEKSKNEFESYFDKIENFDTYKNKPNELDNLKIKK